MRIVNFVLATMFLIFAFVQINDPDPVIWILIYGSMAVTCILAAFEFYSKKFLIVLAVIFTAYGLLFVPGVIEWLGQPNKSDLFDDIAKMQHPYIEESREFLGLCICIAVLGLYIFQSSRKRT
jgi:hypothetical protein